MHSITRRDALRATAASLAGSLAAVRSSRAQSQPAPLAATATHADPLIRLANIDLPTGTRLHFAERGEAAKPVIVCLHGYSDSWHSYRLVMPLLSQTHRVIAFDMRGHGHSVARDDDYSLDAIAGDFLAAMKAMSIDRAMVVGHSFGSFVARRIATLDAQRVDRLVLVGAGLTANIPVCRDLHAEVVAQGESISREFVEAFQASTALDRTLIPQWFFEACILASLSVKPRVWRDSLHRLIADPRVESEVQFRCPTLVLGGEVDAVFSADQQRTLAGAISGSKLLLYRHCGHAPNWEQPLRVVEDLQAFAAA